MCSVPWRVFSTVEDTLSTVGDILTTMRDVQYRRGYHDKRGRYLEHRGIFITIGEYRGNRRGYFEYSGGCSVQWEDMIHVRYHEYCGGCSVPWRYSNNKR